MQLLRRAHTTAGRLAPSPQACQSAGRAPLGVWWRVTQEARDARPDPMRLAPHLQAWSLSRSLAATAVSGERASSGEWRRGARMRTPRTRPPPAPTPVARRHAQQPAGLPAATLSTPAHIHVPSTMLPPPHPRTTPSASRLSLYSYSTHARNGGPEMRMVSASSAHTDSACETSQHNCVTR